MLEVICIPVTLLQQNARVLACTDTREAAVIDPGGDTHRILDVLKSRGWRCTQIWLTHSHFDHCGGVRRLQHESGAPLLAHAAEREFRAGAIEHAAFFGYPNMGIENCPEPDQLLAGGETLMVGNVQCRVLFAPGHSPGHLCFHVPDERLVVTGDVLFAGSVGRTDLPGGNHKLLMEGIRTQLMILPPETRVLPGHGPDTSIGVERGSNPFLTGV